MYHNPLTIKEGAFIVSDAHYSHLRPELFTLIQDIYTQKLKSTQLIFMGDIFDALFGSIDFTCKQNSEIIKLINEISQRIEVIYLEGNHDFNLKMIFPYVKVFSIRQQPVEAVLEDKKLYLAHGDFDGTLLYRLYTAFIRNPIVLILLKQLDIVLGHMILKRLDDHLGKKNDCKEFEGFEDYIQKRLNSRYKCDYFIEGHYHQNKAFDLEGFHYINLGAFACNQRYFIVKSAYDIELLEEKKLSKEM